MKSVSAVTPVILDTDIGIDIDDHWAVALALGSPEFDVRLITVTSGALGHRADILAQLLVHAGRTDIPIGLGVGGESPNGLPFYIMPRSGHRYSRTQYPGQVISDGAIEITRVVRESPEPVTIISVCQATTLAAALELDPTIVGNSRVVSMATALRPTASSDPNVNADPSAFRRILESDWELGVAPLEMCRDAFLSGARWERFRRSRNPLARMIVRDYLEWFDNNAGVDRDLLERWGLDPETRMFDYSSSDRSSCLPDPVAVAMAYGSPALGTERLRLAMGDDSVVRESPTGREVEVATTWTDLEGFLEDLSTRVLHTHRSR